jgi:hypothetical protein
VLLYDPAKIEPENWLTEHLGEVVLLAPGVEEIEAGDPDELTAPASPSFVEHRIGDGFGRPPWDDRVVPRESIELQEPFPDDDWDFDEVEERLAIMTIDGELTEEEARAALGLPPVLPSFYETVDQVTGGCYPTAEDWLEATRRWIERCAGCAPGGDR